jgi:hypothetical protein
MPTIKSTISISFSIFCSVMVIADVIEVHVKQCLCFVLDEAINCMRPSHSPWLAAVEIQPGLVGASQNPT